ALDGWWSALSVTAAPASVVAAATLARAVVASVLARRARRRTRHVAGVVAVALVMIAIRRGCRRATVGFLAVVAVVPTLEAIRGGALRVILVRRVGSVRSVVAMCLGRAEHLDAASGRTRLVC